MVVSSGQISLPSVMIVKDKHEPYKTVVPALTKQGRHCCCFYFINQEK